MEPLGGYGWHGSMLIALAFLGYQTFYVVATAAAAKILGVHVRAVSIGYGPRILGFRWGGTEWRVSAVPLAGHTQFSDRFDEAGQPLTDESYLRLQGAEKVLLQSIGPLSSIALGLLVLAVSSAAGRLEPHYLGDAARIGWIRQESAFHRAGVQAGDQIVGIGYGAGIVTVQSWRDSLQVLSRAHERTLLLQCIRNGRPITLQVPPSRTPLRDIAHRAPPWNAESVRDAATPLLLPAALNRAWVDGLEAAALLVRRIRSEGEFDGERKEPDNGYSRLAVHRFSAGDSQAIVLLGMIGIWLGLLNLLPLPGLAGGHIALTCIERALGRELSTTLTRLQKPWTVGFPSVEFAFSALILVNALLAPTGSHFVRSVLYFGFAVPLTVISWRTRHLGALTPNLLTLSGTAVGLAASSVSGLAGVVGSIEGAVLAGGCFYAMAEAYYRLRGEEGLGMGAVKAAMMVGSFTGPAGVVLAVFVASLGGSIVGAWLVWRRRTDLSAGLPFSTFLTAGGTIVMLGGRQMIGWYLTLLK